MTWLIAAVNDIYSMSKTRSRVISPALVFQKQSLCSVLISIVNLKRTNVSALRKFCHTPYVQRLQKTRECEQEGGGVWCSWPFTVPALNGSYFNTHMTSAQFCNSFHTSQVLTSLLTSLNHGFLFPHMLTLCLDVLYLSSVGVSKCDFITSLSSSHEAHASHYAKL